MKKILSIIIVFISLTFSLLFVFLPKETFSSDENRYLEKWPSLSFDNLFDGEYTGNLGSYIADHFPYRKSFLEIKTRTEKSLGVTKQSDVYYGSDNALYQEYPKPMNSDYIINRVNDFTSNLDMDIDFMLVPTSIYIYNDRISKYNTNYDEGIAIDYYKNNLNINFIDVRDMLYENRDKELYYKTDHHWTTLGAYYAYLVYCDELGIVPREYEFEIVNREFYGTLYSKIIDNSLSYDTIWKIKDDSNYNVYYEDDNRETDSLYNDDYLEEKDKYSYFLNGNQSLVLIDNEDINDGNNILIIKDSYANCFIPFLVNHYDKVHVIDPRYYGENISEYIDKNDINRVLFLYNVMTIDDDGGIIGLE